MRVNVGTAKTNLSRLLARVEAGEEVVISRDGSPVAKLVKADPDDRPSAWFDRLRGVGAERGPLGPDFEFTDEELDELFHSD